MNDHLNILTKRASFDLKCCNIRWRLGLHLKPLRSSPGPLIARGFAPSTLATHNLSSILSRLKLNPGYGHGIVLYCKLCRITLESRIPPLFVRLLNTICSSFLVSLALHVSLTFFQALKCTSVWLTPCEALYKYLYIALFW